MHRLIILNGIVLFIYVLSFCPEEGFAIGKKSSEGLLAMAEIESGTEVSPLTLYGELTRGKEQGVLDAIGHRTKTLNGNPTIAPTTLLAQAGPSGACPQPRNTQKAPRDYLQKENPLPASKEHVKAGEKLYHETAKPLACVQCHGKSGDGQGPMGAALVPPPRNFTCGEMMKGIPDGQLFWIIKKGVSWNRHDGHRRHV